MNKVICGDCLKVLPTLPPAKMIFADPPDNTGQKYDGFVDRWPSGSHYIEWLVDVTKAALRAGPDSLWLSYYWKWDFHFKGALWYHGVDELREYEDKPFVWWYTFGQHQNTDCGSCFRPMLRFSKPGTVWNTDDIREPSARLRKYNDKRANPKGRVPGDVWEGVWEFPRVCGTFAERRKYHPNQHPEALIERIVRMSTKPGDLVIDLFGGTGTVNRVCQRLGRNCIGIEISQTYCNKIQEEA